ncbi:hypothetical protein RvY_18643 [Ramazzottius varieornatus]|uniref:Uncharacterized protein n=1 Tax=Ramazzottius varieornatus TaxID=947166 RepID=A0A1D1W6J4_RAMVA|nr:hypothetical protein RvY_18643 [Ramazzottius varieornatus]
MIVALEITLRLSSRYPSLLRIAKPSSIGPQNAHQYSRSLREPVARLEPVGVHSEEKRLQIRVPKEFHPLREDEDDNDTHAALQREEPKRMARHQWERIKYRRQEEEGPPNPSLLTYAAKEQLLYLHRTDPETWTPHRLSTAFPLSVVDVRRVLRKHRKPRLIPPDPEEVAEQDRLVAERWKALKSGKGGDIVSQEQREAYAAGTLALASPSGVQPSFPGIPLPPQPIVLPPPPLGPVGRLLTTYLQREEAKKLSKMDKDNAQNSKLSQSNQLVSSSRQQGTVRMGNTEGRVGTAFTNVTSFTTAQASVARYSYEPNAPGFDRYISNNKPVSNYKGAEVVFDEDEEGEDEMDMRMRTSGRRVVPPGKVSHEVAKERLLARLDKPDKFGNESVMGEAYRKWFEESEAAAKPSITTRLQTIAAQKENKVARQVQPPKWKGGEQEEPIDSQVPRFRSLRRQFKDWKTPRREVRTLSHDEEANDIKIRKDDRPASTVYRKGNAFYDQNGAYLYSIPS